MATENQNLTDTLRQLHEQLATARQLDPDVAAQLRQTLSEIQQALGEDAAEQPSSGTAPGPLSNRLSEAALHFEESHPKISLALGRLIDGLGQMGI
jgi:hypothetical protein